MDFRSLASQHGTPLFVYDSNTLRTSAQVMLDLQLPYGLTVRYAAKANPHPQIIQLFNEMGLHFDASSTYEAQLLLNQGIAGRKISLSAQTIDGPLEAVLQAGVLPIATSLRQIELLKQAGATEFAVRVNPGIGSGHNNRTSVGGPASSFGIWHEYIEQALQTAGTAKITRLHTHIGSGADPAIWRQAIQRSLAVAQQLPDVTTLDIGGGYKVARMGNEVTTDMNQVAQVFNEELMNFAEVTGRQLHLEIEPGTYLVANAGTLLTNIEDIVDTGTEGYTFLRLNTGMNDILRPSIYGAQHPITILNEATATRDYVLVGHNCESGDILTPAAGDPEGILPRTLNVASVGDVVAIGGAGAYCASMSAHGYNAFPNAKEVYL